MGIQPSVTEAPIGSPDNNDMTSTLQMGQQQCPLRGRSRTQHAVEQTAAQAICFDGVA